MASTSLREGALQPVVETTNGKVRGMTVGASASSGEFPTALQPLVKIVSCRQSPRSRGSDVRDAFDYGPSAPQNPSSMRGRSRSAQRVRRVR